MLSLDNLSVSLDDGTAVVKETEVVIEPGERVLVAGRIRFGQEHAVRAVAGCGHGAAAASISTPTGGCSCCRNVLHPSGTRAAAVAYPAAADNWTIAEINAALDKVGLEYLKGRIEEDAPWTRPCGRRKAAPRLRASLLHSPDIVVLDEANVGAR